MDGLPCSAGSSVLNCAYRRGRMYKSTNAKILFRFQLALTFLLRIYPITVCFLFLLKGLNFYIFIVFRFGFRFCFSFAHAWTSPLEDPMLCMFLVFRFGFRFCFRLMYVERFLTVHISMWIPEENLCELPRVHFVRDLSIADVKVAFNLFLLFRGLYYHRSTFNFSNIRFLLSSMERDSIKLKLLL